METFSQTHVVVIPSYQSGPLLRGTVEGALAVWPVVWVVVDGSTDGSDECLVDLEKSHTGLRVLRHEVNAGKGASVWTAAQVAREVGFTHILTMDSDGQHCVADIPAMMKLSGQHPDGMILGKPIFDESAPRVRVMGREISNVLARVQTCFAGIGDCLFGFRVYPVVPLVEVLGATRWARRFDFDPEVVVRLAWRGVTPVNFPSPVCYPRKEDGGVSQFRYLRDNVLLTWMHTRLLLAGLVRYPVLIGRILLNKPPYRHD